MRKRGMPLNSKPGVEVASRVCPCQYASGGALAFALTFTTNDCPLYTKRVFPWGSSKSICLSDSPEESSFDSPTSDKTIVFDGVIAKADCPLIKASPCVTNRANG